MLKKAVLIARLGSSRQVKQHLAALRHQGQLLLILLALGHIHGHADGHAPAAVHGPQTHRAEVPNQLSTVAAAKAVFALVPALRQGIDRINVFLHHGLARAIGFFSPVGNRWKVLGGVATELRPGLADGQNSAIFAVHHDRKRGLLNGLAKARFALAQGLRGLVSVTDITEHQHHPNHCAGSVADRRGTVCNLVLLPVTGQQHGVIGQTHHLATGQDQLHRVGHRRSGVGIDDLKHLDQRMTQGFGQRPGAQALCYRIHPGDATGGIGGDDRIANGLQGNGQVFFVFMQCFFTLAQRLQQPVETGYQVTDFVLAHDRQGPGTFIAIREQRQRSGRRQHRRELAAQHPPGQTTGQQGQQQRGQQHTLLHGADRGKGFIGRQ
ncbi:hypothetical protein GALL_499660 [mine drainage metagenome]|uniref:Uncharacterized protein n=1 Tax=mine drainage metagenome TaxID=410659 RepID=A0A1J5PA15_9ZZZZ